MEGDVLMNEVWVVSFDRLYYNYVDHEYEEDWIRVYQSEEAMTKFVEKYMDYIKREYHSPTSERFDRDNYFEIAVNSNVVLTVTKTSIIE